MQNESSTNDPAAEISAEIPQLTVALSEEKVVGLLSAVWRKNEAARIREELVKENEMRRSGPAIPKLTARSAPRYIAAVAMAVKTKQLDAKQANAMLYAAQLLIAASRLDQPASKKKAPARAAARTIEG